MPVAVAHGHVVIPRALSRELIELTTISNKLPLVESPPSKFQNDPPPTAVRGLYERAMASLYIGIHVSIRGDWGRGGEADGVAADPRTGTPSRFTK